MGVVLGVVLMCRCSTAKPVFPDTKVLLKRQSRLAFCLRASQLSAS